MVPRDLLRRCRRVQGRMWLDISWVWFWNTIHGADVDRGKYGIDDIMRFL